MPLKNLNRATIEEALKLLSYYAAEEDVVLEMCIYGGTAMLLAYDSRDTTKDVDAIIHPESIGLKLANRVAKAMNLHEGWLNTDVKMYLGQKENKHPLAVKGINSQHLKIHKPTASYLLAMKCLACRNPLPGYAGDLDDIRFLIGKMGIQSIDDIQKNINKHFDDYILTPRSQNTIQKIIDSINQP